MIIKMMYFAWVRERIGYGEETITAPDSIINVANLLDWLTDRDPRYIAAFADRLRLRVAINQTSASLDALVADASEIAIFPPVTGG